MPSLPIGTVTFLFTDIEGFTRLLERLKDAYADVLVECRRRLVRTAAHVQPPATLIILNVNVPKMRLW